MPTPGTPSLPRPTEASHCADDCAVCHFLLSAFVVVGAPRLVVETAAAPDLLETVTVRLASAALPPPKSRGPPAASRIWGIRAGSQQRTQTIRLEKDGHGRDRPPVALFRHFSHIARHSGGERGGRRPGGDDALAGGRRVGRPCRHRGGHGRLARGDAPRRGGRPLRTTRSWVRSTSRFTTTSTTTATPPSLPTPTSAPTAKTTTRARRPSTRGSST